VILGEKKDEKFCFSNYIKMINFNQKKHQKHHHHKLSIGLEQAQLTKEEKSMNPEFHEL
jgi:hypothetical protein